MGAKKLQMSAQEIVTSYKTAADPKKQIRILAELNACTVGEIEEVLIQLGAMEKSDRRKPHPRAVQVDGDKARELLAQGLTDEERKAINFDHPDAFDWKLLIEQVNELRHGKAIEQPTYSYILSNRLPETIHVEPKPVIIIEGIMTLINRKLRDMMDLKIFVDCDSDERLIRNIQRDTIDRGRTVSMVVDRYLKVLKPMHEQFIEPTKRYADLIIPQGGENVRGISILCKYIEGLIK